MNGQIEIDEKEKRQIQKKNICNIMELNIEKYSALQDKMEEQKKAAERTITRPEVNVYVTRRSWIANLKRETATIQKSQRLFRIIKFQKGCSIE
ncbi:unnamed protein product (macronuclear) [Paramecium tetraurelia]|uniref:Uncharacterized protein n=1 Tax=Paramecium tetraurelia TaxID=5888 RepID=A0C4V3_PARTE|nr:uncharacterized protein GSPATT00006319001 [Paramecium tetraurelia]CAK65820.1 unnamed protein product [Paramecium tetraurelia]|eukprot:XP_001433217.1 hypothetical protein (macronuclear) [Paramecium tetraurelia strain d4-2]